MPNSIGDEPIEQGAVRPGGPTEVADPAALATQEHDETELSATEAAYVSELAATDRSDRSRRGVLRRWLQAHTVTWHEEHSREERPRRPPRSAAEEATALAPAPAPAPAGAPAGVSSRAPSGLLVEPTGLVVSFSHAPTAHEERAKLRVSVVLSPTQLRLSPPQLGMVCAAADYMCNPERFELWRRHRPAHRPAAQGRQHSAGLGALWWRAAGAAVIEQLRLSRPPFSWEILLGRREQRKRYVSLYAAWLRHAARGGRRPTDADRAERVELEREIPRDARAESGLLGTPQSATARYSSPPPPPEPAS